MEYNVFEHNCKKKKNGFGRQSNSKKVQVLKIYLNKNSSVSCSL